MFDEERLVACASPDQLLRYDGQVYVRDLAVMLEEILYLYRPHRVVINSDELLSIFSHYDTWVTKVAIPGDPEMFDASTAAAEYEAVDDRKTGCFQKQKLISARYLAELTRIAQKVCEKADATVGVGSGGNTGRSNVASKTNAAGVVGVNGAGGTGKALEASQVNNLCTNASTLASIRAREPLRSPRWSDIRRIIDFEEGNPPFSDLDDSAKGTPRAFSVQARSKLNQRQRLRIADSTVPFQKFARWLHAVLKRLAVVQKRRLGYVKYCFKDALLCLVLYFIYIDQSYLFYL